METIKSSTPQLLLSRPICIRLAIRLSHGYGAMVVQCGMSAFVCAEAYNGRMTLCNIAYNALIVRFGLSGRQEFEFWMRVASPSRKSNSRFRFRGYCQRRTAGRGSESSVLPESSLFLVQSVDYVDAPFASAPRNEFIRLIRITSGVTAYLDCRYFSQLEELTVAPANALPIFQ